ncbi:MAG: alpha/beta fold hydrolase [Gemmataceae bacterium]
MPRCHYFAVCLLASAPLAVRAQEFVSYPPPAEVRAAFLKLLDRPKVPLDVRPGGGQPGFEELTFASERKADGTVERVPVLIARPATGQGRLPAVIVLHGTGGTKEGMAGWLKDLAGRGMIGVAIDARYHGARANGEKGSTAYQRAITRAWRAKAGEPTEHPLYYDTVWDLWRLLDYLETRPDVDPKRIGMTGTSMGGIETWLAAAADERVAVAVPAIGVQSFRWSLDNDRWQGRANTVKLAHETAAADLGEPAVNRRVCRELWGKVLPGITDRFDGPSMLRLFAGRPLLVLNGETDPNCPIEGARLAFAAAEEAFRRAGAGDRLKVMVASGVGHKVTDEHHRAAIDWFARWLAAGR